MAHRRIQNEKKCCKIIVPFADSNEQEKKTSFVGIIHWSRSRDNRDRSLSRNERWRAIKAVNMYDITGKYQCRFFMQMIAISDFVILNKLLETITHISRVEYPGASE